MSKKAAVKIIALLKRKPDLTMEAFIHYYENNHAPLVLKIAPFIMDYRRNYARSGSALGSLDGGAPDCDVITGVNVVHAVPVSLVPPFAIGNTPVTADPRATLQYDGAAPAPPEHSTLLTAASLNLVSDDTPSATIRSGPATHAVLPT